jgi:hypothetical protein
MVIAEHLEKSILFIRGRKVMLSLHLAEIYDVEPRALLQAVKRNSARFPADFMLQLSEDEVVFLRSQNVILETKGRGTYSKYPLYAFTQEGVAMLSSVLRSPQAIEATTSLCDCPGWRIEITSHFS